MNMLIRRLQSVIGRELDPLLGAAEAEAHRFVQRLVDDWGSGANRFDSPDEALFGAYLDGRLVGICGLNRDPYTAADGVGRVRHLYVLPEFRGQGIGGELVQAVMTAAAGRFRALRLRTDSQAAKRFYERRGFQPTTDPDCTHVRLHSEIEVDVAPPL